MSGDGCNESGQRGGAKHAEVLGQRVGNRNDAGVGPHAQASPSNPQRLDLELELRVVALQPDRIETRVEVGGRISNNKGLNIPDVVRPLLAAVKQVSDAPGTGPRVPLVARLLRTRVTAHAGPEPAP